MQSSAKGRERWASVRDSRLAPLLTAVRRLARLWRRPDLPGVVRLRISDRLTRSLGRCRYREHEIVLASRLFRSSLASLLNECLTHELAHLVRYLDSGKTRCPHGAAWRQLMAKARVPARTCVPSRGFGTKTVMAPEKPAKRRLYEHRCPVCQMVRFAKRQMRAWRCAACVSAGLPGLLVINCRERASALKRHEEREP